MSFLCTIYKWSWIIDVGELICKYVLTINVTSVRLALILSSKSWGEYEDIMAKVTINNFLIFEFF